MLLTKRGIPSVTAVCAARTRKLASRTSTPIPFSTAAAAASSAAPAAANASSLKIVWKQRGLCASSSAGMTSFALRPTRRSLVSATSVMVHGGHPPHGQPWASSVISSSRRGMMSKTASGGEAGGPERRERGGGADGAAGARGAGDEQQDGSKEKGGQQKGEGEYDEDYEPEEDRIHPLKMVAGLCVLGLVVAAIGATVTELMPTHMAPQSIMSRAHDVFQADPDTANHFGTPLKVYGRDNNRHREGRRNFVEHVDHEDPTDGSKRARVRFNVEGPNGHGMAYAEVSNKMAKGEWVYLCVQDMQTGHVITLHDNRAMLLSQAQAGSDEEKNAFRKMLGQ